jgi:glycosyltransferase involved in cell wall biosynthesis
LPEPWRNRKRISVFESEAFSVFSKVRWLAHTLPRQVNLQCPDLFWGPAHRLPNGLNPTIARVVTIHDMVWKRFPETMPRAGLWMERWRVPIALRSADAIIAVSQATADDIVHFFPETQPRVHVVLNGVDPVHRQLTDSNATKSQATKFAGPKSVANENECRAKLRSLGIEKPYLLFVGTLEPRKNLRRVVEAFAKLPVAIREQHLLVIAGGSGWSGVDPQSVAAAAGISDKVRLTGYVDDSTLDYLYAQARLLLMPSLYEGFGLPLVEAMAHGIPVVTSNRSSMPQVAADAALLVDPESVDQICAAIVRLVDDEALRTSLAEAGKKRAASLSWSACARATREVFEQAVQGRDRRLTALTRGAQECRRPR